MINDPWMEMSLLLERGLQHLFVIAGDAVCSLTVQDVLGLIYERQVSILLRFHAKNGHEDAVFK